jgi:hypothetical protein
MAISRRGVAQVAVSLAALAALAAPAVLALATGWIEIHFTAWSEKPGPDTTPIEVWALLALFYIAWVPLVFAGLVVVLDRLGYKWTPVDRPACAGAKKRRFQRWWLKCLWSRQAPPRRRKGGR